MNTKETELRASSEESEMTACGNNESLLPGSRCREGAQSSALRLFLNKGPVTHMLSVIFIKGNVYLNVAALSGVALWS